MHINKVVFYRFSQYVSNILVLSRYYFILRYYYIIYIIIYRENKRCASWVVDDPGSRAGVPSIVGGVPPGWWMMQTAGREFLPSWAVRLLGGPVAYSSRSRQAEPARTPQCGGRVILVNLSPRDRNSKCNALNINYFISPFRICRATRNCRRGGNYAREMIYNHLKHK